MAPSATRRPTPVFVLGLQRSGTTWLAGILAEHSRATAMLSDGRGIHESILFSHYAPAYGDLKDEANFQRFATDFTSSDFYHLSGVEPSWFWEVRPRTYAEALRALMEEVARQRGGADLWIEKSPDHTLLAEQLATAFPDARFVGITRRPQAAIASALWSGGRRPPSSPAARLRVLLKLRAWRIGERWLKRFSRNRDSCILTTHERLLADPEAEARRICGFLGIEYEPAMLEPSFRANTSFKSPNQRRRALTVPDKLVVAVAGAALRLVPSAWWHSMVMRRQARVEARDGIVFPEWVWSNRDANRLIFGVIDSLAEDSELRDAARTGQFDSFAPLCKDKFLAKAVESPGQGREFFERAFEDPDVRRDLADAVGREVYQRLESVRT